MNVHPNTLSAQPRFQLLPPEIALHPALNGQIATRLVWGALYWRCGGKDHTWVSVRTICEDTSLSRPVVFEALSTLEKHGFISREHQWKDHGGQRSNMYHLKSLGAILTVERNSEGRLVIHNDEDLPEGGGSARQTGGGLPGRRGGVCRVDPEVEGKVEIENFKKQPRSALRASAVDNTQEPGPEPTQTPTQPESPEETATAVSKGVYGDADLSMLSEEQLHELARELAQPPSDAERTADQAEPAQPLASSEVVADQANPVTPRDKAEAKGKQLLRTKEGKKLLFFLKSKKDGLGFPTHKDNYLRVAHYVAKVGLGEARKIADTCFHDSEAGGGGLFSYYLTEAGFPTKRTSTSDATKKADRASAEEAFKNAMHLSPTCGDCGEPRVRAEEERAYPWGEKVRLPVAACPRCQREGLHFKTPMPKEKPFTPHAAIAALIATGWGCIEPKPEAKPVNMRVIEAMAARIRAEEEELILPQEGDGELGDYEAIKAGADRSMAEYSELQRTFERAREAAARQSEAAG